MDRGALFAESMYGNISLNPPPVQYQEQGPRAISEALPKKRHKPSAKAISARLERHFRTRLMTAFVVQPLTTEAPPAIQSAERVILKEISQQREDFDRKSHAFTAVFKHLVGCLDVIVHATTDGSSLSDTDKKHVKTVLWRHRIINATVAAGLHEELAFGMIPGLSGSPNNYFTTCAGCS